MWEKVICQKKKKNTRQLINSSRQHFVKYSPKTHMKHSDQNVSVMATAFCRRRELWEKSIFNLPDNYMLKANNKFTWSKWRMVIQELQQNYIERRFLMSAMNKNLRLPNHISWCLKESSPSLFFRRFIPHRLFTLCWPYAATIMLMGNL